MMSHKHLINTSCIAMAIAGSAHAATVIASNSLSDATNVSIYNYSPYTTNNTVSNDGTNTGWGDNIYLAQSFTTGTLGGDNVLSSISVATVGNINAASVTAYLYQRSVSQPFGWYMAVESQLASATLGLSAATGPATITFDFSAANLTLASNTVYAFHLVPTSGTTFTWAGHSDGGTYTGGEAMILFASNLPGNGYFTGDTEGASTNITGDRVFSVTAVPEPSAALLGGLGMLALLRRRR